MQSQRQACLQLRISIMLTFLMIDASFVRATDTLAADQAVQQCRTVWLNGEATAR